MRRRRRDNAHGAALFGATGWLFADLFVALTMAFLVANTIGKVIPPKPFAPTPTPTPTMMPTPTPTPPPLPVLNLNYITIQLNVDYQGLLNGDATAIAAAQQQVRADPQLAGKRAGMVLIFGGTYGTTTTVGIQVAQQVQNLVLMPLAQQGFVFIPPVQGGGTVYRDFIELDNAPSVVVLNVYVFK